MTAPRTLPEPLKIISYQLPKFHYLWTSLLGVNKGLKQTEQLAKISNLDTPLIPPASTDFPKRILFLTMRFMGIHVAWESAIALAMRFRYGTESHFLTCGETQQACEMWRLESKGKHLCKLCNFYLNHFCDTLKLNHSDLSDYIDFKNLKKQISAKIVNEGEKIWEKFCFNELNLREMVGASFCRHLREYRVSRTPQNFNILKNFLLSAAIVEASIKNAIDKIKPDLVIAINGKFFPEKIAIEICKKKNIPIITHERGALMQTITLNWNASAIPYNCSDGWIVFKSKPLSESQNKELEEYLYGRRFGKKMQVNFWPSIEENVEKIEQRLGFKFAEKPTDVLFTNVIWDTAVYNEDTIFPSMFEWIDETIKIYKDMPERRLIIRVHPSEIRDPFLETIEKVVPSIKKSFPTLPENVFIIPPESDSSSYALLDKCERVLVYTSTIGLEAAILGKPVVQSANSNYSNKGFSIEPLTKAEYKKILEMKSLSEPKDSAQLARRFAYLLYFRYMIPINVVSEMSGDFRFNLKNFNELAEEEKDKGLSKIIECIRFKKPFYIEKRN